MGIFKKKAKDSSEKEKKDIIKKEASSHKEKINLDYDAKNNVLISSIITEKTHSFSKDGKYVFSVKRIATKRNIKYDIERKYNVTVKKVNVIKIPAKKRTIKHDRGYQSVGKKAIVTLKKGETIALFETA